ncbi:MAG TPA: hypothetical protein VJJ78_00730 [Candidatus Saccharimonadales bacterium]|nr:hypothetical protein [Candidatus Saccharimonadales bacterium]
MGSFIEINDTLRISKEQGFPSGLDIEQHLENAYKLEDFKGKVFNFTAKPKIRVYKVPPVRNFLVEDLNGKWLYWGLCYILEITHDYEKQVTSGKFKIIRLNTPEEMKKAFDLADYGRPELNYF